MVDHGFHVAAKRVERGSIRFAARSNGDVDGRRSDDRQKLQTRKLAEAAFEPVTIDCRVLMTRNHDPDARNAKRGSKDPDIEMNGPNSLPLSNDGLNIRTPRQPVPARKVEAVVRRPRTCLAV